MSEKDGGSAFPMPHSREPGAYETHPGMTLRDWFAGRAMSAIIAKHPAIRTYHGERNSDWAGAAVGAYEYADAMLAERAKVRT